MANYFKNKYFLIILLLVIISMIVLAIYSRLFYNTTEESSVIKNYPKNYPERQIVEGSSIMSALKTYHNEEYGFEFQYPENWTLHADTFYSPFSRFNLVGASPEENGRPNPIASPLLINIVTPDFAEGVVVNRKNLGAMETDIVVGGINGKKYEYIENIVKISIDLPFGEYKMILGADKKHEDVFNQILTSFKFLK